jgi:hypothetical protein
MEKRLLRDREGVERHRRQAEGQGASRQTRPYANRRLHELIANVRQVWAELAIRRQQPADR